MYAKQNGFNARKREIFADSNQQEICLILEAEELLLGVFFSIVQTFSLATFFYSATQQVCFLIEFLIGRSVIYLSW